VRQRCEVDNQIRGLLKTFGILVGKAPGGLRKRAAEIAGDELAHQPELARLVRLLLALRETLCDQIAELDRQVTRQAKAIPVCRRFMTVPGVGHCGGAPQTTHHGSDREENLAPDAAPWTSPQVGAPRS
jgi:transposase